MNRTGLQWQLLCLDFFLTDTEQNVHIHSSVHLVAHLLNKNIQMNNYKILLGLQECQKAEKFHIDT